MRWTETFRSESGHKWLAALFTVALLSTGLLLRQRNYGSEARLLTLSAAGLLAYGTIFWDRVRRVSRSLLLILAIICAIVVWIRFVIAFVAWVVLEF